MATAAQIAANRANAQKSTGPVTIAGRAASSMNALKHGADAASIVIPGEDPAAYRRLAAEYHVDLQPAAALERFQVDTIIRSDWQRQRLGRIEANLYRILLAEGKNPEEVDVTVLRDSPTGKLLLRIWSQIASLERAHNRALAELRRLRRGHHQAEAEAIEHALLMPELEDMMTQARERYRQRNEANSAAKSEPNLVPPNPWEGPAGPAPASL